MSVIRKYPFIQSVMSDLTDEQKESLLSVINGSGTLVNASFSNMPAGVVTPVLFQFDATNSKTGILIQSSHYKVLIAYHRFQDLLMFKINSNHTYEKINEYLDINELRRVLDVGEVKVTAGEIDSGNATEGQVLAADGDGGAEWLSIPEVITESTVESGDAVKLFGFDSEGNLVKDDIPEGITVSNTLSTTTEDVAVSGPAVAGFAYSKEETDALLETKANVDGNYQTMTVGLANNFDSKLVENDQSAYNFRPTATMGSVELEVGSPCKVKSIVGGTVAFNQFVENGDFAQGSTNWNASNGSFTVSNGIATFTATAQGGYLIRGTKYVANHKYFIGGRVKLTSGTTQVRFRGWNGTNTLVSAYTKSTTDWQYIYGIASSNATTTSGNIVLLDERSSGWDAIQTTDIMLIDLTQMFGETIANYIYTLEQGTAGAGVAWFKRYFNKPYYAYNAGTLVSVKTSGKKIVKFNQWDEEWENGGWTNDGLPDNGNTNQIRNKNSIQVLPNTTYYMYAGAYVGTQNVMAAYCYDASGNFIDTVVASNRTFTTPANCYQINFRSGSAYGTTYNNDICINFHYDGERDGEYEPYETETYAIEDVELLGIPKLDTNNNLVFDGDEYASDGTVTNNFRKITVQATDITTVRTSTNTGLVFAQTSISLASNPAFGTWNKVIGVASNGYVVVSKDGSWLGDLQVGTYAGNIDICNASCTTLDDYKALAPFDVIYKLATPTTDSADPFTETQECDNWGTEQFLAPAGDTRPCEVPVGHDTDYLPDLKAKLESAPTTPSDDGYYVLEHDESAEGNTNLYTALGAALVELGYVKLTDITGYDETKTQTLKNVEGTLVWVDDE